MTGALSLSSSYFYHHENVWCGENTSRIKRGSRDAWQGFSQCHYHLIIVEPRLLYFLAGLLTDRPAGWNALGSSVRNVLNALWTEQAQETREPNAQGSALGGIIHKQPLSSTNNSAAIIQMGTKGNHLTYVFWSVALHRHNTNTINCCKRNLKMYTEFSLISKLFCSVF